MKEATGELSTTVIAIVAIAAILAVFTVFLLPTLRAQIALTQACSNGGGYITKDDEGNTTVSCDTPTNGSWKCTAYNNGKEAGTKTCSQK
ncbi:MAG TPA: hypothetical protein DCY94_05465 [Firmicutes bacterium]|nr:hypothetical protein [Bacillota bacterium]